MKNVTLLTVLILSIGSISAQEWYSYKDSYGETITELIVKGIGYDWVFPNGFPIEVTMNKDDVRYSLEIMKKGAHGLIAIRCHLEYQLDTGSSIFSATKN